MVSWWLAICSFFLSDSGLPLRHALVSIPVPQIKGSPNSIISTPPTSFAFSPTGFQTSGLSIWADMTASVYFSVLEMLFIFTRRKLQLSAGMINAHAGKENGFCVLMSVFCFAGFHDCVSVSCGHACCTALPLPLIELYMILFNEAFSDNFTPSPYTPHTHMVEWWVNPMDFTYFVLVFAAPVLGAVFLMGACVEK